MKKEFRLKDERVCLKELTDDICDYHKFVYFEEDIKQFIKEILDEIDRKREYLNEMWLKRKISDAEYSLTDEKYREVIKIIKLKSGDLK